MGPFGSTYYSQRYFGAGFMSAPIVEAVVGVPRFFPRGLYAPRYFPTPYFGGNTVGIVDTAIPTYYSTGAFSPRYFARPYFGRRGGGRILSIKSLVVPVSATTSEYVVTDGLTSSIPIPGTSLSFRFDSVAAPGGAGWEVQLLTPALVDLTQVLAGIEQLGEPALLTLFGYNSPEPYRSLKEIWYGSDEAPMQVAAVATALALRLEEARVVRDTT